MHSRNGTNGHADQLAIDGGPKAATLPWPAYPVIGSEEVGKVVKTLMDLQLSVCIRAGVVEEMENAYARFFGAKYAHAFNAGTSAIASALFAVGAGPGTQVLTASHTWISAITAICHAGGTPVFCDIKKGTHHIDPEEIRRRATPDTRAVIVTHLWGHPADMDPILKVARELKIAVIEDVSHAHGGKYKGKYLGTIGDMGAFSLQGSKAIVAGEGGILLTNNKRLYERSIIPGDHAIRLRSELSLEELKPFTEGGGAATYRIAPLCAAVAVEQIKRLNDLNAARQANFDRLAGHLSKVKSIRFPKVAPRCVRGWYGAPAEYVYDQDKVSRDAFVAACQEEGVRIGSNGYANWYTVPLFQDPKVYGQLWPVEHVNGVRYQPLKPGALVNNEALRQKQLLFQIPAVPAPDLMDQMAHGVLKVATQMQRLADRGQSGRKAGRVAAPRKPVLHQPSAGRDRKRSSTRRRTAGRAGA